MTVSAYRPMGPRNATLPIPTRYVIGFMHDPDSWPWMEYTQLVNVGGDEDRQQKGSGVYSFKVIEPDVPARLTTYGEHHWAWDAERPAGETFKPRIRTDSGETSRFSLGWRLGIRTVEAWERAAEINPEQLYQQLRMSQAQLLRASQAVDNIRGASYPATNTSSLASLLTAAGIPAGFWDQSNGTELTAAGNQTPGFQIIKKTLNVIARKINLFTNGAVRGKKNELVCVVGPKLAQKIAESGEIVNYLKQQANAKADLMQRNGLWGIPDDYAGWKFVVEDTVRVFVRELADGTTVASTTAPTTVTGSGATVAYNERDYLWNDDTAVFCSRPGGLDGGYGHPNFSSFQMFYYGPLARVKADLDQWNEIVKGAIDLEHQFQAPALLSAYKLTGTLSSIPA